MGGRGIRKDEDDEGDDEAVGRRVGGGIDGVREEHLRQIDHDD